MCCKGGYFLVIHPSSLPNSFWTLQTPSQCLGSISSSYLGFESLSTAWEGCYLFISGGMFRFYFCTLSLNQCHLIYRLLWEYKRYILWYIQAIFWLNRKNWRAIDHSRRNVTSLPVNTDQDSSPRLQVLSVCLIHSNISQIAYDIWQRVWEN